MTLLKGALAAFAVAAAGAGLHRISGWDVKFISGWWASCAYFYVTRRWWRA